MLTAGRLLLLMFSLDTAAGCKRDFKINQVRLQERFFRSWAKNPTVSVKVGEALTLMCKSNTEWEFCQIKSPLGKNCSLHRDSTCDSNQALCHFGKRAINLHVVKAIRHRYPPCNTNIYINSQNQDFTISTITYSTSIFFAYLNQP